MPALAEIFNFQKGVGVIKTQNTRVKSCSLTKKKPFFGKLQVEQSSRTQVEKFNSTDFVFPTTTCAFVMY